MYKSKQIQKLKTVAEKLSRREMKLVKDHFTERQNFLFLPEVDYLLNDELRKLCRKLVLWHAGYYRKGYGMVLWHLHGFNKIKK